MGFYSALLLSVGSVYILSLSLLGVFEAWGEVGVVMSACLLRACIHYPTILCSYSSSCSSYYLFTIYPLPCSSSVQRGLPIFTPPARYISTSTWTFLLLLFHLISSQCKAKHCFPDFIFLFSLKKRLLTELYIISYHIYIILYISLFHIISHISADGIW